MLTLSTDDATTVLAVVLDTFLYEMIEPTPCKNAAFEYERMKTATRKHGHEASVKIESFDSHPAERHQHKVMNKYADCLAAFHVSCSKPSKEDDQCSDQSRA